MPTVRATGCTDSGVLIARLGLVMVPRLVRSADAIEEAVRVTDDRMASGARQKDGCDVKGAGEPTHPRPHLTCGPETRALSVRSPR
jgi:hypothetical protein